MFPGRLSIGLGLLTLRSITHLISCVNPYFEKISKYFSSGQYGVIKVIVDGATACAVAARVAVSPAIQLRPLIVLTLAAVGHALAARFRRLLSGLFPLYHNFYHLSTLNFRPLKLWRPASPVSRWAVPASACSPRPVDMLRISQLLPLVNPHFQFFWNIFLCVRFWAL